VCGRTACTVRCGGRWKRSDHGSRDGSPRETEGPEPGTDLPSPPRQRPTLPSAAIRPRPEWSGQRRSATAAVHGGSSSSSSGVFGTLRPGVRIPPSRPKPLVRALKFQVPHPGIPFHGTFMAHGGWLNQAKCLVPATPLQASASAPTRPFERRKRSWIALCGRRSSSARRGGCCQDEPSARSGPPFAKDSPTNWRGEPAAPIRIRGTG
jgi:hypothetical protein